MENPPDRRARRRWLLRRLLFIALTGTALLAIDYFAYPYGRYGGRTFNRGENGLWIRYTWYFGEKSDSDFITLADRLKRAQIRYAYFHVRSIERDGRLKYRYPDRARKLTDRIRRLAPNVELLAWIYAGNRKGAGEVDLTRPEVRRTMVSEAVWLVEKCGFDGVQWDYEICAENEPGFLELLRETRAALRTGAILSAATPINTPWPLGAWGWSEDYYARVSRECDQLCVMTYDTGAWLPRTYAWLAHRQAVRISRVVASGNPECRLLIGLPTYGPGFISHNPQAENISIALKGVREGLTERTARPDVVAGVALFADYTTDELEWRSYERLWVK